MMNLGLGLKVPQQTIMPAGKSAGGGAAYTSTKHISFDGVSEYAQMLVANSFPNAVGTTGGTISFWIKSDDFVHSNQTRYLTAARSGNFPGPFEFFTIIVTGGSNSKLQVQRSNLHFGDSSQNKTWYSIQTTNSVASTLTDNTWHHIAFTTSVVNAPQWAAAVYINGSAVNISALSTADAGSSTSQALSSANQEFGRYLTNYYDFDYNEIGIWSTPLSATEISYIYNQGVTGFDLGKDQGDYSSSSDLWSWHKMGDEDQGSSPNGTPTDPDSSGNNRPLLLFNTPTVETT